MRHTPRTSYGALGARAQTPSAINTMADLIARDEINALAEWLFDDGPRPPFVVDSAASPEDAQRNERVCTEEFCAEYREVRCLGMSQEDAAASLGVLPKRLRSLFTGAGVAPKRHKLLVLTEIQAPALYKRRHLETLRDASADGNWRASMQLLERTVPEYNPKQTVTVAAQPEGMSSADYERLAGDAQRQLKLLREKNIIRQGG